MIKRMSIFQGVFTKGPASWFILHIFLFRNRCRRFVPT